MSLFVRIVLAAYIGALLGYLKVSVAEQPLKYLLLATPLHILVGFVCWYSYKDGKEDERKLNDLAARTNDYLKTGNKKALHTTPHPLDSLPATSFPKKDIEVIRDGPFAGHEVGGWR